MAPVGTRSGVGGEAAAHAAGPSTSQGPSKRQRLEAEPDYAYEPKSLVDLHIITAGAEGEPSKRIGVHKVFLLRYSKFYEALLADVPSDEVPVAEAASDIQTHLLDVMYKTSGVAIGADKVLRVLALADKYEAPTVIQACRAALCSPDFKLGPALTTSPPDAPTAQPCPLEIICMAAKYGPEFDSLAQRGILAFVRSMTDPESASAALQAMTRWEAQLQTHLSAAMLNTLWSFVAQTLQKVYRDAAEEARVGEAGRVAAATARELEKERSKYASLLRKHNQFLGKAQTMGLLGLLKPGSGGPGGI